MNHTFALTVLTLPVVFSGIQELYAESEKPNLLIVFPDQMRYSAIGALGIEPVKTPNLDRFMGESIFLSDAVSNYPVCSPFRAMLMSGKYPVKNNVWTNCHSKSAPLGCELPADAICWSDILSKNDYALGYIGKWHLDSPQKPYIKCRNNPPEGTAWNEWCPPARRHGFQYWYAYGTYDAHLRPMYWDTNAKRDEFHYVDEYGPKHEADKALAFFENKDSAFRDPAKPFALTISMNPPHTGYQEVPKRYHEMYKDLDIEALCAKFPQVPPKGTKMGDHFRKNIRWYYAQCTAMDEQFGRILDGLKKNGLDKNTIVLFTSDHGDLIGMHNEYTKNVEYKESMQIPFMIRWPEKLNPRTDTLMISTPDIAPTLLSMMGLTAQIPMDWEGTNLAQTVLSGKGPRPDGQLYFFMEKEFEGKPDFENGRRGWRDLRWTYVLSRARGKKDKVVLFDRKNDPSELQNVAEKHPEVCTELNKKMERELHRVNPQWKNR